jgi:small subunit ribosomal protein S17
VIEEENETTEDEAPAEDAPADEAPAGPDPVEPEEAEAQDAGSDPVEPEPSDAGDAGGSDPTASEEEPLTPKQQRKLERARHTGEALPQRGPEERAAERADRRAKASAGRRRSRARARSKHEAGQGTPPAERVEGSKKVRQGTVVSSKADKTITVRIEIVRRHPVYEKVVRRTATIHAHDESNDANAGDVVRVIESRPLSRTKRWRLVEVLERAR